MKSKYSSDSIKILSDVDHVRLRSGMYIGSTESPISLFNEAFDNAIDEASLNKSKVKVDISIDTKLNYYIITDTGRGIPQGIKEVNGSSYEVIDALCTKAFSGGKFNNENYHYSSGLNGLGLLVINSLSSYLRVDTKRDGKSVMYVGEKGVTTELSYSIDDLPDINHGTRIIFQPDPEIFDSIIIPLDYIVSRCKVASSFGIQISLKVDGEEINVFTEVSELFKGVTDSNLLGSHVGQVELDGEMIVYGLAYTNESSYEASCYTNLLVNSQNGTHEKFLWNCIKSAWNYYKVPDVMDNDYALGLRVVVAVFIQDTSFSSQTKDKLTTSIKYFDKFKTKVINDIWKWLKVNEDLRKLLIRRFQDHRASLSKLKSNKKLSQLVVTNTEDASSIRRRSSVVTKLKECTQSSRDNTELFLVEGDSACLRGDTKIRLIDDTDITIKELCEQLPERDFYVYGKTPKGTPYEVNAYKVLGGGITRKNALLYRVYFDNNSYVDCTIDHKFMTSSREFKELAELSVGESISVIPYHQDRFVANGERVHRLIYKKYVGAIPENYVIHHKDGNHYNNSFENLECTSQSSHASYHNQFNPKWIQAVGDPTPFTEYWKDDANKELQSRRVREYFSTPSNRKKTSIATKKGMSKMTTDQHKQRLRKQAYTTSLVYYKDLIYYRKVMSLQDVFDNDKYRAQKKLDGKKSNMLYMRPQTFMNKYNIQDINEFDNLVKNANHRITKIECLDIREDVYDITVDEVHNFCLSNDVVVHNCGTMLQSRNTRTQAILPLRGKILNVVKLKNYAEALKNEEILSITNALGCGLMSKCNSELCRYDKLIFSTDADEDGKQIAALLTGLVVKLYPDLVKAGMVYMAQPPLYGWYSKGNFHYSNNFNDIPDKSNFTRFKGLGEMDADELAVTIMNPDTRSLVQILYPEDEGEFDKILTSSNYRFKMLENLGVIKYVKGGF